MFTAQFWRSAAKRALHTVSQALLGALGGAAVFSDIDWKIVLSSGILGGVLSFLKSIVVGTPEGGKGALEK